MATSHGLEAVRKTVELHPDVVSPGSQDVWSERNQMARKIRQLSKDSKVVILTKSADDDLMAAALQAGASAYVLKSEMTTNLIPAVQTALGIRC